MRMFAAWVVATRLLPRNYAHAHLSFSEYGSFPGLWTVTSNRASVRVLHLRNQFIHKFSMRDGIKIYGVYLLYCRNITVNINEDCMYYF
jgi:hypothetical protein